ncbi:hypothetical protein OG21DRAFT_1510370 [Imleria badia]|nr:hypothetical protein OG21DRAFT_1510370 [Imleria badia]
MHHTPPTSDLKSATELAQKHPDQFLSDLVFSGLLVDEFKFSRGSSGNLGLNMISQSVVVPAQTKPGTLQPTPNGYQLAIHLNCIVKPSALQNNGITLQVQMFHITARSVATQKKIDAYGPSVITADNSIHINVNTEWGRADNLKALAEEVGIAEDQTLHFEVRSKQGYNNAYMRVLVKTFRAKVEQRIHQQLGGNVVVKYEGDKTFPTQ